MSRRPVTITDKQKKQVEALAGFGLRDSDISTVVGLAEATMQRRCKAELKNGRAKSNAQLAQCAMQMALSKDYPVMTMFMCKVRLNWREKSDIAVEMASVPGLTVLPATDFPEMPADLKSRLGEESDK